MGKSRSNQPDDYMVQTVRLKTEKGLSSTKAGRLLDNHPNWVLLFVFGIKKTPVHLEQARLILQLVSTFLGKLQAFIAWHLASLASAILSYTADIGYPNALE